MAISSKLRQHMKRCGTRFEQLPHSRTFDMQRAAQATHVSGNHIAKGVLVKAGEDYLLAVVPASHKINLTQLRRFLGRNVGLATEVEAAIQFDDCEFGAIPAVGAAYGLGTVVDDEIFGDDEIFFEGGDHRTLIAMTGSEWRKLLGKAAHCTFSAIPV